jgi:hypothetical protein
MGMSRASARFAVLSKRRDGCLVGSSVTEFRGHHEIIDSFIIEYDNDKPHREEGVETETEEVSETKEVDEWNGASSGTSANTTLGQPTQAELFLLPALIKKKIKFSSYIRKFRVEQLQSHI